jgi:hypothetical protein
MVQWTNIISLSVLGILLWFSQGSVFWHITSYSQPTFWKLHVPPKTQADFEQTTRLHITEDRILKFWC